MMRAIIMMALMHNMMNMGKKFHEFLEF